MPDRMVFIRTVRDPHIAVRDNGKSTKKGGYILVLWKDKIRRLDVSPERLFQAEVRGSLL